MKIFNLIKPVFAQGEFDELIGNINPPAGVGTMNIETGGPENIGILLMVSRLLQIVTVVASIWVRKRTFCTPAYGAKTDFLHS